MGKRSESVDDGIGEGVRRRIVFNVEKIEEESGRGAMIQRLV